MVTPLFIVLIAIGSIDLLFALDSIPAVFGVTDEPYIVFAANAFALLGLRALFFLVKGLLDRLVYLSTGLALILAFIGVEADPALGAHRHQPGACPEISTPVSLGVILVVLVVVTVASLMKTRKDPTLHAHAGSITGHKPRQAGRGPAGDAVRCRSARSSARSRRTRRTRARRPPPRLRPCRCAAAPARSPRAAAG